MDATKRNYYVDILMGLVFLAVMISGLLEFPPLLSTFGIMSWPLPWNLIRTIHMWGGVTLVVLVLAHFALHWQWVVNVTRSVLGKK